MDNKEKLPMVSFNDLREDVVKTTETDAFWVNVPEYCDGYILTSRVTGV